MSLNRDVAFTMLEQVVAEVGSTVIVDEMILHINDRLNRGVKPAATYVKCLERIVFHREQLGIAYNKLVDTYARAVNPAVRTSPIDKARAGMMEGMDDKMLRQFATLHLADKADDFVLPDERDELIDSVVRAMKNTDTVGQHD